MSRLILILVIPLSFIIPIPAVVLAHFSMFDKYLLLNVSISKLTAHIQKFSLASISKSNTKRSTFANASSKPHTNHFDIVRKLLIIKCAKCNISGAIGLASTIDTIMASAILSIAKNALMRSICAGITVTGNIIPQEMPGLNLNAKLYFKFRLSLFRCLSCLLGRYRCRNGESEQLIHD